MSEKKFLDESGVTRILTKLKNGDNRSNVTIPTASGSFIYDGTEKHITWNNVDSTKVNIQGVSSAVNAGTYYGDASIKDSYNNRWTDGSNGHIQIPWTIAKANQTITVSKNKIILNKSHLSVTVTVTGAQGIITASSSDTSIATVSVNGNDITVSGVNMTDGTASLVISVSATDNYNAISNYTVPIIANYTFAYEEWLIAGGIDPSGYNDLNDVLADETAVRRLMTIHDSVDYITENFDRDPVNTIINNDICAKWINLRDYALDTLYANEDISAVMDAADKYFYGEWTLVGQVPTMTSNTAPYGEVGGSSEYSAKYAKWKAFNGNPSTTWTECAQLVGPNAYLYYKFVEPICITWFYMDFFYKNPNAGFQDANFKIQASNDGTTWIDLTTEMTWQYSVGFVEGPLTNNNNYLYYKFQWIGSNQSNGCGNIGTLQFYAWGPKGNVPIMTSNTAPYGEAFSGYSGGTTSGSDLSPYQSFDNNSSTYYYSANFGSGAISWVGYTFTNPVKVKSLSAVLMNNASVAGDMYVKLQGSNDGTTWTDLTEELKVTFSSSADNTVSVDYDVTKNEGFYLKYRLFRTTSGTYSNRFVVISLQFYGRELKVSVPTMTSDTAPYGEASMCQPIDSSVKTTNSWYTTYQAYVGFNKSGKAVLGYGSVVGGEYFIQYHFTKKVKIMNIAFNELNDSVHIASNSLVKDMEFYTSNDGTNWTKVGDATIESAVAGKKYFISVNNPTEARYFRFKALNNHGETAYTELGCNLQFYGLDYSEYDWDSDSPRHYIYDHGVELEAISVNAQSGIAEKQSSEIYLQSNNGNYNSDMYVSTKVDLTDYSLIRSRINQLVSAVNLLTSNSVPFTYGTNASGSFMTFSSGNANLPNNLFVDIVSLNGQYFIDIAVGKSSSVSVTEWWLE